MRSLKNSIYVEFGNKIAEHRILHNLTQEDLAEKLHVSSQAVSKWENGKCFPKLKNIIEICRELEINYIDFFESLFK